MTDLHAQPDGELVEACLAGRDDAWAVLVDRYANLVYSIPARTGLGREDRDDVFQTVWSIAVRHLAGLRDRETLAAWLITTTQRECWRVMRQRDRRDAANPDWVCAAESDDADENALLESRQRLRHALARLDDRCRELLLAVFSASPPSYDHLAEQIGIPRGSIGPTRARCLEKLATIYNGTETEKIDTARDRDVSGPRQDPPEAQ